MKQDSHEFKQVFEICNLYLLLGDIPALQEFAQEKLRDKAVHRDLRSAIEVLEFYAGQRDAVEFLKNRENTGGTTFRLWTVGLSELAEGNRTKARERFEQVRDEGLFHTVEFCIGLAYAERMSDPSWPPWITNNQVDSAD